MPLLNTADGLYVGASVATKAYLGSSLVWQDSGTPPPVGASLRGITVATPTVRDTTVNTMAGTLNGDTVFVIRSMNYIELTAMSTPSATGIGSWTLIEKVKYGNVLIGAWKGTVTSDGVKTITLGGSAGSAADGSSNFGLCYTHAVHHEQPHGYAGRPSILHVLYPSGFRRLRRVGRAGYGLRNPGCQRIHRNQDRNRIRFLALRSSGRHVRCSPRVGPQCPESTAL